VLELAWVVLGVSGMVKTLEELLVHQKAIEFCRSINTILDRPALRRDRKLHEQINDANDSITANLSEGFEQSSDAAFASYVHHSKASAAEVLARLRQCQVKGYITDQELASRLKCGEELKRMMSALIRYLAGCNWRDRGRFKAVQQRVQANTSRPTRARRTRE
jgi:four helix bundle protein